MSFIDQLKVYYEKLDDLPQRDKARLCATGAGVCFFFFFVLLGVYAAGLTREATTAKRVVMVTTDAMPDDLLALKYLFKRGDLRIRAIVVTANGYTTNVAAQVDVLRRFLSLLIAEGCRDAAFVEVGVGATVPSKLRGGSRCALNGVVPPALRVAVDSGFGNRNRADFYNSLHQVVIAQSATWATLQQMRRPKTVAEVCRDAFPTDADRAVVEYVSLGPMTHVAACSPNGVKRIVASGGTFAAPGNVKDVFPPSFGRAELNVFFDPYAAANVLHDGVKLQQGGDVGLVPLDAAIDAMGAGSNGVSIWGNVVTRFAGASSSDGFIASAFGNYSSVVANAGLTGASGNNGAAQMLDIVTATFFADGKALTLTAISPVVKDTVEVTIDDSASIRELGEVHQFSRPTSSPLTVLIGRDKKDPVAFLDVFSKTMRLPYPRRS